MIRDANLMEDPRWLIVQELWCNGVCVVSKLEEEQEYMSELDSERELVWHPQGDFETWLDFCTAVHRVHARIIAFQCVLIFTPSGSMCRTVLRNLYNTVIDRRWPSE